MKQLLFFGTVSIGLFTIIAARAAGAKDIIAFDLSEQRLERQSKLVQHHIVYSGKKL